MSIVNPRSFVLCLLVVAAAACGGKSTPAGGGGGEGGGGTTPTEPAPAPLAPGQWAAMDHEAREHHMEKLVFPEMEAAFKKFDAERFAEFNCATCHGKGAADHTWKMPNPDLPELTAELFSNPPPEAKPMLEFMGGTVKPEMAKMLGLPEYSQDNPTGFGCMACHVMKQ